METTLVIKAPNQNIDDHTVHCNLEWTVGSLKNHLSEFYPSKPVVQDQKLIYSGRLIDDHMQLKDILRLEDDQITAHTLHLVIKGQNFGLPQDQSSVSSQVLSNSQDTQIDADSNAVPSVNTNLRHRSTQSTSNFYPQFQPAANAPPAMPVFTGDTQVLAQMAAMQQMYAYYFTQYVQSMNSTASTGGTPVISEIGNVQQQTNPNEPAQRPANQRMNAQGGRMLLEENDEIVNRDWLDHLFLCCRFLVFFCIVYFYSTPERLMIVIVCAIIAFLYHEGWFVRRTRPIVVAEMPPQPQESSNNTPDNENATHPDNADLSANEELSDGHELEAAMDGDNPPHAQDPDVANNNNQIFSPLTFLSTFFSSLIPDPPPPMNLN